MIAKTNSKNAQPMYDPSHAKPAYHLRYTWTGWPSESPFAQTPVHLLDDIKQMWETDGIRLLEYRWTDKMVQLLFSAKPSVSPVFLASRAKGRLDHAIRGARLQMPLTRKLAVRSIGVNSRQEVEKYIERQVGNEQFVDTKFEALMNRFTVVNNDVDLSQPNESVRGRYWYNLHLVLVTSKRFRMVDQTRLAIIRDWSIKIAKKKAYSISRLSVMPDHLHVAMRGDHAQSPNDIVFGFQNNISYALNRERIWKDSFYAGTFGEYNMAAVRTK